jgi:hypothetical protein
MNTTLTQELLKKNTQPITGWKKAKSSAEKLMEKGNFTIDDVKQDLEKIRSNYTD